MRYKMSQVFVKTNILKISPLLLFFSLLSAQWFEGNLYLPDSFSGTCGTCAITWNSIDDKIYLIGFNETFVTIDGESDEKVQPIRIDGNERSHPGYFEWNGGNNCLYIWCYPYCAYYDSLFIVDCQTQQTISTIAFPRNSGGNEARMCASPISNKVYLIKQNNGAGSDLDTLIYVIDGNNHQIIKTIRFENYSYFYNHYQSLKWNPVNNCLYAIGKIPGIDTTGLAVIDCANDSITALIPFPSLDFDQNIYELDTIRNRLYISVSTESCDVSIYEIDGWTNQKIQRIDIPNATEYEFEYALNQAEQKIYYAYLNSRFIYTVDIPSGIITDSIFVGFVGYEGAGYLAFFQPNNELYCISRDTVSVVNLSTRSVSYYGLPDEKGVGVRPFLHPIRGKLYIERGGYGEAVVVFDCLAKTVRNIIYTGTQTVNDILLNPIEHKLYCTTNYRPYVFIFNSETNQALRQLQVAPRGYGLASCAFVPFHNKVYICYPHHIVVLNGRTDSVIKTIDNLISHYRFAYNPFFDRLYTMDISFMGEPISYIIDCTTDSIVKVLNTTWSPDQKGDIEYDSLTNKVYMVGNVGGMVIIDCFTDSVIKRDTNILRGDIHFRTHGDRRVYAGKGMYDRFNDTLIGYLPFVYPRTFTRSEYNQINDKIYLALDRSFPSNANKIYVVDCNTGNISDSILGGMPGFVTGMFWNRLNNKLYFSPLDNDIFYEPIKVVDCLTNEIIATFPQINRASFKWSRCFDPYNNRCYIEINRGSKLGMIKDNIPGIEECNMLYTKSLTLKIYPNPAKSVMRVRCPLFVKEIKIFDVLGKLVKEEIVTSAQEHKQEVKISLKGINPGIYFLRLGKETKKFLVVK